MSLLLPIGALLLLGLGAGKSRATKRDETPAELAARIAREGKEIIKGERDAFSDDDVPAGPQPVSAPPASDVRGPSDQELLDAAVRAAVEQADADARSAAPLATPKPAPIKGRPAPKPKPKPAPIKGRPAPIARPAPAQAAPQPAPAPARQSAPIPPGYDPAAARRMAPQLARHLQSKGRSGYDRPMVRSFQTKAAITSDGIYGGATRGALLYFGAPANDTPAPFFPPLATAVYVPPEQRT